MESSLDDAIRCYNGDTSRINRWDEPLEQEPDFGEEEAAETAEAVENAEKRLLEDRPGEDPAALEPSYREMLIFRNLESMDEYTLEHTVRDLLNEKLGHTQEYLAELQISGHPDAKAVAQVHETLYEIAHEAIVSSVERGYAENFVTLLHHVEYADEQLMHKMREENGFVQGETYLQPKLPEDFTSLETISGYAQQARGAVDENRTEMPALQYDIADKLLEKLEVQMQMTGEWETPGLTPWNAEDYRAMRETAGALEYMTRGQDPVFWKLARHGPGSAGAGTPEDDGYRDRKGGPELAERQGEGRRVGGRPDRDTGPERDRRGGPGIRGGNGRPRTLPENAERPGRQGGELRGHSQPRERGNPG